MERGHGIPWLLLIVGAPIALTLLATVLALIVPLVYSVATGGGSYQVRDDAMAPALLSGDWVLAEAYAPGALPARGDVVAYELPLARSDMQIGRVAGLPGERLQMRGGALYIDGRRVVTEQIEDRIIPRAGRPAPSCINPGVPGDDCHQEQWREQWPGGVIVVALNTRGRIGVATPGDGAPTDNTQPVVIPEGQVFVLADNRDGALDSRVAQHGLVPAERVRLRVWLVHTSLDRASRFISPRFERFFRRVE